MPAIEFFDADPFVQLGPRLVSEMAAAQRADIAVAFLTEAGAKLVRYFLHRHSPADLRLLVSVRWPTDLEKVRDLHNLAPGSIFIHTGYTQPREPDADRGQFHSKVALLDYKGDRRLLFVGSNNWTQCGLLGENLEAGMLVERVESDRAMRDARAHINACHSKSEPFDPARMRFYQAVQRRLQPSRLPGDSEDFPGLDKLEVTVIHAEDHRKAKAAPLRMFIPIRSDRAASYFPIRRDVWLFLYDAGALLNNKSPPPMPRWFRGRVTMVNDTAGDQPVERRAANCSVLDLVAPALADLAGNVPPPGDERDQVIALLHSAGEHRVPLFHLGEQRPKLRIEVKDEASPKEAEIGLPVYAHDGPVQLDLNESDGQAEEPTDIRLKQPSVDWARALWQWEPPAYRKPVSIEINAIFQIASNAYWPESAQNAIRSMLFEQQIFHPSDEPNIRFEQVPAAKLISRYVYPVTYYLNEDTFRSREQQRGLFG